MEEDEVRMATVPILHTGGTRAGHRPDRGRIRFRVQIDFLLTTYSRSRFRAYMDMAKLCVLEKTQVAVFMNRPNKRFETDAPPASFACRLHAPQAKR